MAPMTEFLNIWEIERNFKCPVIGAMLTVEKHKSILKKCGWDVRALKPYEYHSYLMGCMGDENAVSRKTNNFIRHQAAKYMKEVAALYNKEDAKGVRTLWERYAEQGVIGPVMYAIVSHKDTDIELLQDIHGEVHMLSHANMNEVFTIRKRLEVADQALAREKSKASEKSDRIRELARELKQVAREKETAALENARLKTKLGELENQTRKPMQIIQSREQEISGLEQALQALKEENLRVERERKQLEIQLFSIKNKNSLLKDELTQLSTVFSSQMADNGFTPESRGCPVKQECMKPECMEKDCPNQRLCARRIFMIGGITKMKSYYRQIVEKAGGEFDYHDGYLKNSNADLAAKVRRCDLVVCPVSCNSHNACLKVKHLCSRYNKELKILNSASLSAVSQALIVPETTADSLN